MGWIKHYPPASVQHVCKPPKTQAKMSDGRRVASDDPGMWLNVPAAGVGSVWKCDPCGRVWKVSALTRSWVECSAIGRWWHGGRLFLWDG